MTGRAPPTATPPSSAAERDQRPAHREVHRRHPAHQGRGDPLEEHRAEDRVEEAGRAAADHARPPGSPTAGRPARAPRTAAPRRRGTPPGRSGSAAAARPRPPRPPTPSTEAPPNVANSRPDRRRRRTRCRGPRPAPAPPTRPGRAGWSSRPSRAMPISTGSRRRKSQPSRSSAAYDVAASAARRRLAGAGAGRAEAAGGERRGPRGRQPKETASTTSALAAPTRATSPPARAAPTIDARALDRAGEPGDPLQWAGRACSTSSGSIACPAASPGPRRRAGQGDQDQQQREGQQAERRAAAGIGADHDDADAGRRSAPPGGRRSGR